MMLLGPNDSIPEGAEVPDGFLWHYGNCKCLNCGYEQLMVWREDSDELECIACQEGMQVPIP